MYQVNLFDELNVYNNQKKQIKIIKRERIQEIYYKKIRLKLK